MRRRGRERLWVAERSEEGKKKQELQKRMKNKTFGKSHQVEVDAKMFDINLFCVLTSVGQTTERLFIDIYFDK